MTGAEEIVVDLRGQGLGEGTRHIVQTAEKLGYTVATAGHGSYRLARSRWRLTGKQTESVLVRVYDERGGTKASCVGPVDPALLQHLGTGTQAATNFIPSSTTVASNVTAGPPAGSGAATYPPTLPSPIARPVPRPTTAPPGGLISAVPGAENPLAAPRLPSNPAPAAHVETADLEGLTIVDLQPDSAPPPPPNEPGLVLPGGTFVTLTAPAVIGRDPDPAHGGPEAVPVPVADPSLSKTHLAISFAAGGFHVTDLHSRNGTFIEVSGARTRCAPGVELAVPSGAVLVAGALVIEVMAP